MIWPWRFISNRQNPRTFPIGQCAGVFIVILGCLYKSKQERKNVFWFQKYILSMLAAIFTAASSVILDEFCHKVGLDYVSCSPFRVPIARLAAAQAAIKNPRK